MVTYKDKLTDFYTKLARDKRVIFIGYNTAYGSRMYGTLARVKKSQCIETPVAEDLMVGLSIGYALTGYRPVLCIERHDFLFHALDGLINHMDKMSTLGAGKVHVLVRAIVGDKTHLDVGVQHSQCYTGVLASMLKHTPVLTLSEYGIDDILPTMKRSESGSLVLIEHRSLYGERG
jgi:pyruvate dehydrogenase E1 component beta subunit